MSVRQPTDVSKAADGTRGKVMDFRNSQNLSAIEYAIEGEQEAAAQNSRRHRFHLGSGAALILMTVIIISLLCFAALSIVSAQADSRLTNRYAEQTSAYYAAQNLGVEFTARVDADLKALYETASGESDYFEGARRFSACVDPSDETSPWHSQLQNILANTASVSKTTGDSTEKGTSLRSADPSSAASTQKEENPVLVFSSPMTDTQEYLLVLRVLYPASADAPRYEVLSSRILPTVSYDYNSSLDVLGHS